MNEIKCPNCGKVFQIDESSYDSIVKQIRDHEFEKEISERERQYLNDKNNAVKLAEAHIKEELNDEISKLKLDINNYKNQLDILNNEKDNTIKEEKLKLEKELNEKINNLTIDNNNLSNQIKLSESENKLAIEKAISLKNKEIDDLNNKIELNRKEYELNNKKSKESFEIAIKQKDEMIEYYKDMKAKFSTKMVGESLERYCSTQFNSLRSLFPNAYFDKDNDIKTGSKGDFIFRDYDDNGNEFISIMFEMKNENEETASKHKNEDFLKELDKDRREKKCEYAVLVSLLELDNDLYNGGITDVSYKYDKMYVIRPQSFISIITLLRNAAYKSIELRKELAIARQTSIDITNFENNLNVFKEGFSRNYRLASDNFNKAIAGIDDTIDKLMKIKDALVKTDNNLRLANKKSEDLTIKKLTKDCPSIKEEFEKVKRENN